MNSSVFPALICSLIFPTSWGCSSEDASPSASGGEAGASTGGTSTGGTSTGGTSTGGTSTGGTSTGGTSTGGTSADANVGTFWVTLNPAAEGASAYTSITGKIRSGATPTDIIETPLASGNGCTTFKFSRQPCVNVTCAASEVCAAPDDCRALPSLVAVGEVSLTGIGSGPLVLSEVNKNYQYAGDIAYPGFEDGATISLTAAGDFYPAFNLSTSGVAPVVLDTDEYMLASGQPLLIEWDPGTNLDAKVTVSLNISRHGGSAGYLQCDTDDSGSLTIPAEPISELIALGVGGFPQLLIMRSTRAETPVTNGKVALEVTAIAHPTLGIEGLCSCNDSSECGACTDATKSVCDSVRRVCVSP
jgi:hypothetical protein